MPSEDIVRGVFLCLFRQGACLRLLGELSAAERKLAQAERLYLKNSRIIYESFYFNALSCRAKVLRDCYRYREAERLHMKVDAEFAADGVNHNRGKNLSSLATLYLAVGDLEKAARCEKQALRLVRKDRRAINHGFLCRIYARAKQFSKADYHLRKARTLTPEAPFWLRRHFRQTTDLFAAEYLALKAVEVKRADKTLERLERICRRHRKADNRDVGSRAKMQGRRFWKNRGSAGGSGVPEQSTVLFRKKVQPGGRRHRGRNSAGIGAGRNGFQQRWAGERTGSGGRREAAGAWGC